MAGSGLLTSLVSIAKHCFLAEFDIVKVQSVDPKVYVWYIIVLVSATKRRLKKPV